MMRVRKERAYLEVLPIDMTPHTYLEETDAVRKARVEYMSAMAEYQKLRTTSDWAGLINVEIGGTKFVET